MFEWRGVKCQELQVDVNLVYLRSLILSGFNAKQGFWEDMLPQAIPRTASKSSSLPVKAYAFKKRVIPKIPSLLWLWFLQADFTSIAYIYDSLQRCTTHICILILKDSLSLPLHRCFKVQTREVYHRWGFGETQRYLSIVHRTDFDTPLISHSQSSTFHLYSYLQTDLNGAWLLLDDMIGAEIKRWENCCSEE